MNFDKVNAANNMLSKSPAFRQRVKYNMQQELAEQKYQDYEYEKQNAAHTNTMASIDNIQQQAKTFAYRSKDKARMSEIYTEAAEEFKNVIATKYGGDITRFWYEGGQAEIERFKQSVLGGNEAVELQKNTSEFAKYFEAIEEGEGMDKVFNSTHKLAQLYQTGQVDTFRMPLAAKMQHKNPDAAAFKNAPPGTARVDVILAHDDNEFAFRLNYANENNLPVDTAFDVDYNKIRNYAATYVGGLEGPNAFTKSDKPRLANTISEVFDSNFAPIDGTKIMDNENRNPKFKDGTTRLQQLAQQTDAQVEAPIYGKLAFEDYSVELVNTFIDNSFIPGKAYADDDVYLDGKKVNNSSGSWFGADGFQMEDGIELEGDSWNILGTTLSYKTVGDNPKILTKEEVDAGYQGQVEPVYVMALTAEGGLFGLGSDDYIYKELDFKSPLKANKVNDLIKYDNASYNKQINDDNRYQDTGKVNVNFVDVDRKSSPQRLYEFAVYNDSAIEDQLGRLSVDSPSLATKAVMLAFSQIYQTDIQDLNEILNVNANPDLYSAIVSDDPQLFIKNLSLLAQERGVQQEVIEASEKELVELAGAIRNSIITQQK